MRIILCGFGVVGQSFAKLLESRSEDLYARYGLKPRIVGVFDRNGSAIDPSGLDINRLIDVKKKLCESCKKHIKKFWHKCRNFNNERISTNCIW